MIDGVATAQSTRADQSIIVVSITGFDETFSQTVHARHIYQVDDMRWGARFADILEAGPDGNWTLDYTRFDDIIEAKRGSDDRLSDWS